MTNVIRTVAQTSLRAALSGAVLACSGADGTWVTGTPQPAPPAPPPLAEEPAPSPPALPEEMGPREPPVVVGSPAFSSMPAVLSNALGGFTAAEAFPNLQFTDPVALAPLPGGNRLALVERGGRIFTFENQPDVPEASLALDLSAVTAGLLDSGLLSLAFHPKFGAPGAAARNYAYVWYAFSEVPLPPGDTPNATASTSRLSRFDVDPATGVFDRGSEQVLIQQLDEHLYHQGGAMLFHPRDGFLYLAVGDEGTPANNIQRIDRDLFSGVLRIDVDERGGGVSHPIPKQPETGQTAHYFIPNDNPFVGEPGVLEEFYALGLRNPHRMSYDPVGDHVWIADVGAGQMEEIDILAPAANYQWRYSEGTTVLAAQPAGSLGVWTDPIFTLPHSAAIAIIGGYVYWGTRYPELRGKYIFGDYGNGTIWALPFESEGASVRAGALQTLVQTDFRGQSDGITSFGLDAAGELYFLNLGSSGRVSRLVPASVTTNAPALLSETGAFAELETLTPVAGAVPYSVNSPFWSDGASKRRWMTIPEGGSIEFAEDGAWRFPEGTVFIKHFSMVFDETQPNDARPLETRLLVAGEGGDFYGLSYRWNAEGTDATSVLQREEVPLEITNADGQRVTRPYVFPGPSDCLVCHSPAAGYVLGVRSEQLNRMASERDLAGLARNQIERWSDAGLFTQPPELRPGLPSLAALEDEWRSVEDRLRSYWAANCSFCHGADETVRANWDARYTTPLSEQGIVNGPLAEGPDAAELVVTAGDPERSAMYRRGQATEPGLAMPPIGRRAPDERYLALLRRWIDDLE